MLSKSTRCLLAASKNAWHQKQRRVVSSSRHPGHEDYVDPGSVAPAIQKIETQVNAHRAHYLAIR